MIGIDLGMMLLALENYQSGYVWEVCAGVPAIRRGLQAAGFRDTRERDNEAPLRRLSL